MPPRADHPIISINPIKFIINHIQNNTIAFKLRSNVFCAYVHRIQLPPNRMVFKTRGLNSMPCSQIPNHIARYADFFFEIFEFKRFLNNNRAIRVRMAARCTSFHTPLLCPSLTFICTNIVQWTLDPFSSCNNPRHNNKTCTHITSIIMMGGCGVLFVAFRLYSTLLMLMWLHFGILWLH